MARALAVLAILAVLVLVATACDDGGSAASTPAQTEAPSSATAPPSAATRFSTLAAAPTRFPAPVFPTPAGSPTPPPASLIPEGFLFTEEVSKRPLNQPGVYWVRNDAPDLPPMLAPCGGPLPSARPGDAIAGRQLVLVNSTNLWKLERLVVYRDAATAAAVLAELRDALTRCARHDEDGGRHTEWLTQPLAIGDEGLFIGGQMYAGTTPLNYHYRGVAFRQGRALHYLLDHGQSTIAPTLEEVEGQGTDSLTIAAALAAAPWAR